MKIGILTIHHCYNYGAILQAYATFVSLKKNNDCVSFVNYDNTTFYNQRLIFLPSNSIENILRNCRSLFTLPSRLRRIRRFEELYSSFTLSDHYWNNTGDFSLDKYDVIVTGSDQTFCLYLTGNPEEMKAFFQENGGQARRVSFASSFGEKIGMLTESDKQWIKERLLRFEQLSVREIKSADFVESLIGHRPLVVCDPVFLLSQKEWENVSAPMVGKGRDYILFYTVLSDAWVVKYTRLLADKIGLRVIAIHPRTRYDFGTGFTYVSDAGPREFISYIKNASYIITTSYHATAFSLIFEKKFVSLHLGTGSRIGSLLSSLNLNTRLVHENDVWNESVLQGSIDYKKVTALLDDTKEKSLVFLNKIVKANE